METRKLSNKQRVERRRAEQERFLRTHPEFVGYVGEILTAGIAHPGSKVGLALSSSLRTFHRHIFGTKNRKGCGRCQKYFNDLKENADRHAGPIAPGSYTLATLPPLTPGARKLLDEMRSKFPRGKAAIKSTEPTTGLLRLEPGEPGLRLEEVNSTLRTKR